MKPYYQDEWATIYHGDCREVLPQLPLVDLVLTDPPYGLNFRSQEWDREIPAIAVELPALFNRCIIITAPTMLWAFPKPDWLAVWYKPTAGSRTAQGGFNHWTPILLYGNLKAWADVYYLHPRADRYPEGFQHPSPKPEKLIKWCLGFAPDAKTVLDPFMGSGTTLRAAKDLGIKSIGIEIEEKYCKLAVERLRQESLLGLMA